MGVLPEGPGNAGGGLSGHHGTTEDTMSFLAVTLLGFTFSGTLALVAVVVVVIAIGVVWYLARQRR